MLIPMKPTFSIAHGAVIFVLFASLTAGCENSSSTPNENRAQAATQPTSATKLPATNETAQRPEPVWPNQVKPESSLITEKPEPAAKDPEPALTNAKDRVELEEEPPPEKDPPIPAEWKALNKDKTLFFEKTVEGKRRIHILTEVCLREGVLEVFLCKANTKEHESIVHVDLDARDIHFALIAAGAKPGTPVKFVPEYKAATGDPIRVTVTYHKDGKLLTKPAQYWIQHVKTKKDMEHDWVFAGSRFFKFPDEPNRPPFYCANNGEVISIANFSDSMLDLPVMSSKEASELGYIANKDRIPPLKTKVIVTLEVLKKG